MLLSSVCDLHEQPVLVDRRCPGQQELPLTARAGMPASLHAGLRATARQPLLHFGRRQEGMWDGAVPLGITAVWGDQTSI